jgi:hypothetical protein
MTKCPELRRIARFGRNDCRTVALRDVTLCVTAAPNRATDVPT